MNPFKKGDRVRMSAKAIANGSGRWHGKPHGRTGTVASIVDDVRIRVRRDFEDGRQSQATQSHISFWEKIP